MVDEGASPNRHRIKQTSSHLFLQVALFCMQIQCVQLLLHALQWSAEGVDGRYSFLPNIYL